MLDKTQLERFKNEARAAASLDHPNVVHVHAVGSQRGVHYYAMQFIEGQTVADVMPTRSATGVVRRQTSLRQMRPGKLSRDDPTEALGIVESTPSVRSQSAVKDTAVAHAWR